MLIDLFWGRQGAYCGQHKLKDMERVNTRRCSMEGCDKRASFNVPGQHLPPCLHCFSLGGSTEMLCCSPSLDRTHTAVGFMYMDRGLSSRACCSPLVSCPGYRMFLPASHYPAHALPLLVRDGSGTCAELSWECAGQPAQYCGQHKSSGMVDVANRRCEAEGCHKVCCSLPMHNPRIFPLTSTA